MKSVLELLKESCKKLLLEGGASGHMTHLFEDGTMTFGELKDIFKKLFSGDIRIEEKCLSPDTIVVLKNGGSKTISEVVDNKINDEILSYNEETNSPEFKTIVGYSKNDTTDEWLVITLEDGSKITCTPNHRIFLPNKNIDVKAETLVIGDSLLTMK